jgi:hypothetical protein
MRQIVAFAGIFFGGAPYSALKSIIYLLLKESCENMMLGLFAEIFRGKKLARDKDALLFRFCLIQASSVDNRK